MHAIKVIREPGICRVVKQGGFKPVGRRTPIRDEPTDRHSVAGDDNRLPVLDSVEDAGEAPCCLRGSHRDHGYILSDLLCSYV